MKRIILLTAAMLVLGALVVGQTKPTPMQVKVTKVARKINTSTSMKVHVIRTITADAYTDLQHLKLTCVEFTTRIAACPELQPGALYDVLRDGNFITIEKDQAPPTGYASWGRYIVTLEEGIGTQ
jgi:hypothetical protein